MGIKEGFPGLYESPAHLTAGPASLAETLQKESHEPMALLEGVRPEVCQVGFTVPPFPRPFLMASPNHKGYRVGSMGFDSYRGGMVT